jgi:hypothetical protein
MNTKSKTIRFACVMGLILMLNACIETTHPLCTTKTLADIPSLSSSNSGALPLNKDNLFLDRNELKIERISKKTPLFSKFFKTLRPFKFQTSPALYCSIKNECRRKDNHVFFSETLRLHRDHVKFMLE